MPHRKWEIYEQQKILAARRISVSKAWISRSFCLIGTAVKDLTACNRRVNIILGTTQYANEKTALTDKKTLLLADFFL